LILCNVDTEKKFFYAHNFFIQLLRDVGSKLYELVISLAREITPRIFPKIPDKHTSFILGSVYAFFVIAMAIVLHSLRFVVMSLICKNLFMNGLQNCIMSSSSIISIIVMIIWNFIICQINYGLLFPLFYNTNGKGWFTKNISIISFIRNEKHKVVFFVIYFIVALITVILFKIDELSYALNWICNIVTSILFNNVISVILLLLCLAAHPSSDTWENSVKRSVTNNINLIEEGIVNNDEKEETPTTTEETAKEE
jgi:hypothetical protein